MSPAERASPFTALRLAARLRRNHELWVGLLMFCHSAHGVQPTDNLNQPVKQTDYESIRGTSPSRYRCDQLGYWTADIKRWHDFKAFLPAIDLWVQRNLANAQILVVQ